MRVPFSPYNDPTRIEDPQAILGLMGFEDDFDTPAKVRARVAALRGDPSKFENDQQYGLAGMMLRGPTAAKLSKTLYGQGAAGREAFDEEATKENRQAQVIRQNALAQTMENIKGRRDSERQQREFDANEGYRKQNLALQWAQERRQAAADARQADADARGEFAAVADPITGEVIIYNKRTGERVHGAQSVGQGQQPQFNPAARVKPTEKMRNDLAAIQQQRGTVQGAVNAVTGNPEAFGLNAKSVAEQFGGPFGQAVANWMRNPEDVASRALVMNNVSKIITERAGATQTAQELQRLRGFLPNETDSPDMVMAKFNAFLDYLDEQEAATRGYTLDELGYTPRVGAGPRKPGFQQPGASAPGSPGSSPDNPIVLE
jgi:hypothetical protein